MVVVKKIFVERYTIVRESIDAKQLSKKIHITRLIRLNY